MEESQKRTKTVIVALNEQEFQDINQLAEFLNLDRATTFRLLLSQVTIKLSASLKE